MLDVPPAAGRWPENREPEVRALLSVEIGIVSEWICTWSHFYVAEYQISYMFVYLYLIHKQKP